MHHNIKPTSLILNEHVNLSHLLLLLKEDNMHVLYVLQLHGLPLDEETLNSEKIKPIALCC